MAMMMSICMRCVAWSSSFSFLGGVEKPGWCEGFCWKRGGENKIKYNQGGRELREQACYVCKDVVMEREGDQSRDRDCLIIV